MRIEEAIKVLHDLQKYRRDQHVPAKYPMPHPKKIGEAIDCAIHNLRMCIQVSRVVEAYEDMNNSIFVQCKHHQIQKFVDIAAINGYDIGGDWLRKATVEEIIEHFNK